MMKTRSRMMKKCRNLKNEIKTRWGTFFAAMLETCRNVPKACRKTSKDRRNWTTAVAQPSWNKHKNVARRQWMRKGQTPPKSEPKTAKNATKPQPEECRNVAYGTPLKTQMTAETGPQPSRNLAGTNTKM